MKKLKCYAVTIDSDVFAVSLVEDPAIESNFITLSKNNPKKIFLQTEEKRIVMGAVLIPDMPIYRNQGGEEFYIQFSRDTIEQLAHNFLKYDRNRNFTIEHKDETPYISVVESWIVNDTEKDKSSSYGMKMPVGTWMMSAKIDDDSLWEDIKNGKANGFSVEAIVGLDEIDEITLKQNRQMAELKDKKVKMEAVEITDGFWDKLRQIISDAMGKPQESKDVEDTVGEIADEIEKGAGPKDEDTKIVEQEKKKKKTNCEDVAPKIDEEIKDIVDNVNEDANSQQEAKEDLQAIIDGLKEEIAKKDAEIESLKKENQKLSKQPSTKPIKTEMTEHKKSPHEIMEALRNGTYFKNN